eukprot:4395348-Lingulodinium_polyedra.AAC.1
MLVGLRRRCRQACHRGTQALSLSDNLSAVLAYAKGRAAGHGFRALGRGAAYVLGCDARWHQRRL